MALSDEQRAALSTLGKLGHESRMRKYGKKYYSELGKKSAASRRAKKEAAIARKIAAQNKKKSHFHVISKFLEHGI